MNASPIGVFDSGMGGLTVMRALTGRLPDESFLYLGDTARLPYGTKSADTVKRYALQASRALMDLAVTRKLPLGNGILTVNTEAQAWARARASELNKGGDAARAALAMLRIKRRLAKS